MRVRIIFNTLNKGATVPFHHQHLIAEVFESIIADFYKGGKSGCLYNFSGLKGQTKVSPNGLQFFSSKCTVVMAGDNNMFINEFLKALFQRDHIKLGDLLLAPESVEKEEFELHHEANKYLCISPLVIMGPDNGDQDTKRFISPFSDQFSDLLYETTMANMELSGKYTAEDFASFFKFQIVPDRNYLMRIKEGEKKFARIYSVFEGEDKFEVRGYTFPFTLYAHAKVHEFVFQNGIGSFTVKGFGMLDLANPGVQKKTSGVEIFRAA